MKIEKKTIIPVVVENCVNKMLDNLSSWFNSPNMLKRDNLCSKLRTEFKNASDNDIDLIYHRLCFKIGERIYQETKKNMHQKKNPQK